MNILLLDDDKKIIDKIQKDLLRHFLMDIDSIRFYAYSSDFSTIDLTIKYQFGFIDIDLLTENGIEIVKELKRLQPRIIIIFVSAHQNLIHDSLIVRPFYFIRKANYEEDLSKFFRLLDGLEKTNEIIPLSYKNIKSKVNVNSIMYVSSFGHELNIITEQGEYHDNRKLKEFEALLLEYQHFVRVHKSFIINLEFLVSYKGNVIYLADHTSISLGRMYKKEFENCYKNYILR